MQEIVRLDTEFLNLYHIITNKKAEYMAISSSLCSSDNLA